jgi:PPOX class probable F420-dependent enzyme
MPSQRERIRMTDAEVEEFLATERTLQVASIGPDGTPHLVAMWFAVIDGRIAFWTFGRAQKTVNLRRDPRIVCMVEAGDTYGELRGVSITGEAELSGDYDTVRAVGETVAARYQGAMTHDSKAGVEAQATKRVAVFVNPKKIASWDHRKL